MEDKQRGEIIEEIRAALARFQEIEFAFIYGSFVAEINRLTGQNEK
jgi:hypothetical protein